MSGKVQEAYRELLEQRAQLQRKAGSCGGVALGKFLSGAEPAPLAVFPISAGGSSSLASFLASCNSCSCSAREEKPETEMEKGERERERERE